MCAACRSHPCLSRCPNASEPEPVLECCWCHEGIFEGGKYIDTDDGPVCKECIDGMTVMEFMALIGEEFSTVKNEEE